MIEQKIIIVVGLQGSGKTTWAIDHVEKHPGTLRVNKDTIRSMLYGDTEWSQTMEDFVCMVRDHIMVLSLAQGFSLVIDDTNLNPKHILSIKATAARHGVAVQFQDFTNAPLWSCIQYDKIRTDKKPVGEETILMHYRKYFEDGKWKHRDLLVEAPNE